MLARAENGMNLTRAQHFKETNETRVENTENEGKGGWTSTFHFL